MLDGQGLELWMIEMGAVLAIVVALAIISILNIVREQR